MACQAPGGTLRLSLCYRLPSARVEQTDVVCPCWGHAFFARTGNNHRVAGFDG